MHKKLVPFSKNGIFAVSTTSKFVLCRELSQPWTAYHEIKTMLTFDDLVARRLIKSRMTLKRMTDAGTFPRGKLISPNRRVWTEEEIAEWWANLPTEKPRKAAEDDLDVGQG